MARGWKKRSRSRRKFRKRMRKTFRRSRKIHKKRIVGRKTLPGNSVKAKMRTEWKASVAATNNTANLNIHTIAQPSVIMSTDNAANIVGVQPMPAIVQGVGNNQAVGNKFYYRYIDVRFTIEQIPDVDFAYDTVRLMMVTQRYQTSSITTNLFSSYTIGFMTNIQVPIETKLWRVHYDKLFAISNGMGTNPALGTIEYQSTMSLPRYFRWKIPFKQNVTIPPVGNWVPDLRTYILAITQYGNARLAHFCCKIYFKDP